MKKNGFAVSGIIYTMLIIFIIVVIGILSLFNSRKNVLDTLKNKVIGEVNTTTTISYDPFTTTNEVLEFVAKAKGYYQFDLYSPKVETTNGSQVTTEIYLSKGETLYFLIGASNYNNGNTEIRTNRNDSDTAIITASESSSIKDNYNGKTFTNTVIKNKTVTSNSGKIIVKYLNKERLNSNLNNVKYIKDCINGSSESNENIWTEITALVDGDNKALKKIVLPIDGMKSGSYDMITDGLTDTSVVSSSFGEQCVVVDLQRTYNLDSITILHSKGKTFYGNKTYVSTDGLNYTLIRNEDKEENSTGVTVSAYEIEQVAKVGNIDVPVKEFNDATWLRVFHHNNLGGTELWSSVSQPSLPDGYDTVHRQSVLSYLDNYKKDGVGFEFLLQYSELDGFNRWIQNTNPLQITEKSSMTTVSGYKEVSISWNSSNWGGLAKSDSGSTLLDGSVGSSNWFYAIGAKKSYDNGIPGPNASIKGSVDLWVRIDNLN